MTEDKSEVVKDGVWEKVKTFFTSIPEDLMNKETRPKAVFKAFGVLVAAILLLNILF